MRSRGTTSLSRRSTRSRRASRLLRSAIPRISRNRQSSQAKLVVVVEDHAAVAGHAEILQQQSPGKMFVTARSRIAWP